MIWIVDKRGGGDWTSLQQAVDSVPAGEHAPALILVRMDEICERVTVRRDNIRIVGEARDRTILTDKGLEGEGPVLTVTGANVTVDDLTIRTEGNGPAVLAAGDRGIWRNCRVQGGEGAFRVAAQQGFGLRQYLADCGLTAQGGPLTGEGRIWLENTTLTRGEKTQTLTGAFAAGEAVTDRALPAVLSGWDLWRPDRPTPTWYLCGDSTMADYPASAAPMTGWGQALPQLVDERVYINNCAVCGRSSKSFVAEKRLTFIELCLRPGDRLFIQFSHNDEKPDAGVYTSPRITYPEYLGMYIDAARRRGAEPVLFTPVARRHFDGAGCLKHTHGAYPAAMRDVAWTRGVRLIDLERATEELLSDLGDEASKALFTHVPAGHPNYPDGAQDNTHMSAEGARRVARLALDMLAQGAN